MSNPLSPIPSTQNTPPGRGLLIVISGPSGVGKTTVTHELEQRLGAAFSVSMTTRRKTDADTEGVDYYFVDHARFEKAIASGELLEWAKVFENYYGTPRGPVERSLVEGRDILLEIDVNGAIQVKDSHPEALSVFILPPSEEELLERLRKRGREAEAVIQRRFSEAQREIAQARKCGAYDYFIVNANLHDAVREAYAIVQRRKTPV
jgi:guanylate kinase